MGKSKNAFLLLIITALPTSSLISKAQDPSNPWRTISIVSGTAATIGLLELAFNKEKRTALLRLVQKKNRNLARGASSPNVTMQVASSTAFALISALALYKSRQNSGYTPDQPQASKAILQETGIQTDSVTTLSSPPLLMVEPPKPPKQTPEEMSVQTAEATLAITPFIQEAEPTPIIKVSREEIGTQTENVAPEKPTLPPNQLSLRSQVEVISIALNSKASKTTSVQTGNTPARKELDISPITPCGIDPKSPATLEMQNTLGSVHISPLQQSPPKQTDQAVGRTPTSHGLVTPQRTKVSKNLSRMAPGSSRRPPRAQDSPGLNKAVWSLSTPPRTEHTPQGTPQTSPFTRGMNGAMKSLEAVETALKNPIFSSDDDDNDYSDGSVGSTYSSPGRIERAKKTIGETDLTLEEQADFYRRNIAQRKAELKIYQAHLSEVKKMMTTKP